MAEYHGRNILVVEEAIFLTTPETVAQAPAGRDRHRRQLRTSGHIADGMDGLDIGVLELVGQHEAVFVELHAHGLEAQVLRSWPSTHGPDQLSKGPTWRPSAMVICRLPSASRLTDSVTALWTISMPRSRAIST